MKRLLTLLVMAALTFAAYPAMANVANTPHNFAGVNGTGSDTGVRGLCETCHVPHAASATTKERLWRVSITMAASDTGAWGTSVVGQLCGTCHSNINAAIGYPNAAGNPPHVIATIYNAGAISHGRTVATLTNAHTPGADQNIGDKLQDGGRPYMNQTYMQCTSCHNPHDDSVRPLLRAMPNEGTISKVCGGCHDRYSTAVGTGNTGPLDTTTLSAIAGVSASMHPVDKTFADDLANNTDKTDTGTGTGTQFHEPSAALKTVVGTNVWALGGKFQSSAGAPLTATYTVAGGTDQIGCQTCHSIHAPAGTADGSQGLYLLAEDNSPNGSNAGAGLCEDCHGGGYNGDPLRSGSNNQYVGGSGSFLTGSNQTLRDHPIDQACDGSPKLEAWGSTVRFERNPGGVKAWPFVPGTYTPSNTANLGSTGIGRIVCTSCHSAHNAKPGTSLNRTGGDTTQFCFSCHLSADMVPGNHHSTTFDGTNGGNWSSSAIQCSSCHQTDPSTKLTSAHMGFFNLNVNTTAGNADSELCNGCHTNPTALPPNTEDPVYAAGTFKTPGMPAPNGHLSDLGQGAAARSHYLGAFVNAANSINVKTGYWMAAVNNGRPGSSYSKYGNTVSPVDNHNNTPPTVNSTSILVCESCHSVLYNCGDGSVTGGWEVNLLLQNYEDNQHGATDGSIIGTSVKADDGKGAPATAPFTYTAGGSGVGSGLCVACHNQNHNADGTGTSTGFVGHSILNGSNGATIAPANMHPMTGWTITRAVDAGFTGTNATLQTNSANRPTYADQVAPGAAPNLGSYDGAEAMSCDGCHRPHRADKYAAWKPGYKATSVSVILESAGPANGDYGTLCQQCHNM